MCVLRACKHFFLPFLIMVPVFLVDVIGSNQVMSSPQPSDMLVKNNFFTNIKRRKRAEKETDVPRPGPDIDDEKKALNALDSMLRNYDRRSTPTTQLGFATNVSCKLFVASLSSIDTQNMDYVTDTYLHQSWFDPRLTHPDIKKQLDLSDPRLVKAIWKPEVYFPNAKEANFQFVTVPNVLVRIHPGGKISYILRLSLKFSCMMELSRYPLDTQICAMQISSFSKTTSELVLHWSTEDSRGAVKVAADLRMPQFTLQELNVGNCPHKNHMGSYSCLSANFHLSRSIGFYLIQSYFPSFLIVAVSWVSFYMDVNCVPARTTIGVITLLTISSQMSGKSVPQTSYVKAIDIWMTTCTAFVFAAFVEFTCVNYLWRRERHRGEVSHGLNRPHHQTTDYWNNEEAAEEEEGQNDHSLPSDEVQKYTSTVEDSKFVGNDVNEVEINLRDVRSDIESQKVKKRISNVSTKNRPNNSLPYRRENFHKRFNSRVGIATRVDEICRLAFPLGFFIFNLLYWTYY